MDKDNPTDLCVLSALDVLIAAKPDTIRQAVGSMDGIDSRVAYVRELATVLRHLANSVELDADALAYGHYHDARNLPTDSPVRHEHLATMYWHEVQCRAMVHFDQLVRKAQDYQDRLAEHTAAWPNDGMTDADLFNQRMQLNMGCHDTKPPLGDPSPQTNNPETDHHMNNRPTTTNTETDTNA
jgi:hypothetical protein